MSLHCPAALGGMSDIGSGSIAARLAAGGHFTMFAGAPTLPGQHLGKSAHCLAVAHSDAITQAAKYVCSGTLPRLTYSAQVLCNLSSNDASSYVQGLTASQAFASCAVQEQLRRLAP